MNDNTNLKNRALGAFAAMGSIPDRFVAAAEDVLFESEAGLSRPPRLTSPLRRFLRGGWIAAVISGIVALTVLFLIIRMGQNPLVNGPDQPPSGSSIPFCEEEADFSIATEEDYYLSNTNRITVVMTGVTPGKAISMTNAWYLEWLTDKGAKAVEIYYTDEAIESVQPEKHQYATISKTIYINDDKGYALQPGSYRLHATVHDGKKYVSVAYCEFEVAEPEVETTIVCDDAVFNYDPRAVVIPFTVTTVPQLTYGTDQITLTVTADEPMVSLFEQPRYWHIQKSNGSSPTAAPAWYVSATSEERFALKYHNGEALENGGYARFTETITLSDLDQWEPGTYLVYALTAPLQENNKFAAYCTFTILEEGETVSDSSAD